MLPGSSQRQTLLHMHDFYTMPAGRHTGDLRRVITAAYDPGMNCAEADGRAMRGALGWNGRASMRDNVLAYAINFGHELRSAEVNLKSCLV